MRLVLEDIRLSYQRGTPLEAMALAGVSLSVQPGERLGIAGPVGSGKSSMLGIMAGLVAPDSGSVLHDGRRPGAGPAAGGPGLCFQFPENCLFAATVEEDITFAPRQLGLTAAECRRRGRDSLEAVGLDPDAFLRRNPFLLSAGEQRRVALAGVLAMEPRALLLDEPTANLDPARRADLLDRLISLNRERGTTIVMVGHDMDEMARFAGRLAIIDGGRVAAAGAAHDLLGDARLLRDHGLKPPATAELSRLLSLALGEDLPPALSEQEALDLLLAAARRRRGA